MVVGSSLEYSDVPETMIIVTGMTVPCPRRVVVPAGQSK